jgi:hypothetical protein
MGNDHRRRHEAAPEPPYRGHAVSVGPYTVFAGGTMYLEPGDLSLVDVLVPLTGVAEYEFGTTYTVTSEQQPSGITALEPGRSYTMLVGRLPDFGGVPDNWEWFLRSRVIPLLADGKRLLGFCMASQGRTGTWLASLVAVLEPDTADPIAAIRQRHCQHAVETLAQAKAIFALRGQDLPEKYRREFQH